MASKLTKSFWSVIGLVVCGLAPTASDAAHYNLDGTWTGTATAQGQAVGEGTGATACRDGTIEVEIDEHQMRGAVHLDGTYYLVQGKVDEDGSVKGFVGDDPLIGRFSAKQFSGTATVMQLDCKREVVLTPQSQ